MEIRAATNSGNAGDALWVNTASIAVAAPGGGVWINDAGSAPVMLTSVTTNGGPIVIDTAGDLLLQHVNAGSGHVTLGSGTGSVLDALEGGSSPIHPNVIGGTVTFNAARTVGTNGDAIWVDADSFVATAPGGNWINVYFTPYPSIPSVPGVAPVTVYEALAQAQIQPPQQLPITVIGQPLRLAPPIEVTADLLGIALPPGADANATQQDMTLDTASKPILGGNDDEIGRTKARTRVRASPRRPPGTAATPPNKPSWKAEMTSENSVASNLPTPSPRAQLKARDHATEKYRTPGCAFDRSECRPTGHPRAITLELTDLEYAVMRFRMGLGAAALGLLLLAAPAHAATPPPPDSGVLLETVKPPPRLPPRPWAN